MIHCVTSAPDMATALLISAENSVRTVSSALPFPLCCLQSCYNDSRACQAELTHRNEAAHCECRPEPIIYVVSLAVIWRGATEKMLCCKQMIACACCCTFHSFAEEAGLPYAPTTLPNRLCMP